MVTITVSARGAWARLHVADKDPELPNVVKAEDDLKGQNGNWDSPIFSTGKWDLRHCNWYLANGKL